MQLSSVIDVIIGAAKWKRLLHVKHAHDYQKYWAPFSDSFSLCIVSGFYIKLGGKAASIHRKAWHI